MKTNQLEQIFSKHFKENMHNKDVDSFKMSFSKLYNKVILPAMTETYEVGKKEKSK